MKALLAIPELSPMRLPLAKEEVQQELITINNHKEENQEVPLVGVSDPCSNCEVRKHQLHVHVHVHDMQERTCNVYT